MASNDDEIAAAKNGSVVASIPWLPYKAPLSTDEIFKIANIEFCTEMQKYNNGQNYKLYQILNQVAPFYLPKRYHAMEIRAMQKHSLNGSYWLHATHFTVMSEANVFASTFAENFQIADIGINQVKPSFDIMGLATKIEQCETAAEFLLEPWVLVQLHVHPILLHQWVVALKCEELRIRKQVTELLFLPYPSHMATQLNKVKMMMQVLSEATLQLTQLTFKKHQPTTEQELNHTSNLLSYWLPQVLPILELFVAGDGNLTLQALKALTWTKNTRLNHQEFKRGGMMFAQKETTNKPTTIYSYEFWKCLSPHTKLCYDKSTEKFPIPPLQQELVQDNVQGRKLIPLKKHEKEDLRTLIEDNIVNKHRLKGVTQVQILKAVKYKDLRVKRIFTMMDMLFRSALTSQHHVEQDENYGVIFNIIRLNADLKFEESVVELMIILASQLITHDFYFVPTGCDQVKIGKKMCDVQLTLDSVRPDDKWKVENMIKQVKATCVTPQGPKGIPDPNQGTKKIVINLQERLKVLVVNMIESHGQKNSTQIGHPEFATVKYLLPCFVAAYLDLKKDNSISSETLQKYLQFVHELIKSYEEKGMIAQTSAIVNLQGAQYELNLRVVRWVKNIRESFLRELPNAFILNNAFCGSTLEYLTADLCGSLEADKEKTGTSTLKPWCLHTCLFLYRVNIALENIGWL